MNLYENELYMDDLDYTAGLPLPWEKLQGRSILISGATGLAGSFLVDVLMRKNELAGLNCTVYALSRNAKQAAGRFSRWSGSSLLRLISHDINRPLDDSAGRDTGLTAELYGAEADETRTGLCEQSAGGRPAELSGSDCSSCLPAGGDVEYVLHMASNTHPMQYATDPIGTITTNIIGLQNMLEFACAHHAERFAFTSSNEIYGENRGDAEFFDEAYCGYIDCNTLRAGYPESKRCGEALCQAYRVQKGLDIVIPRLTRSYGPTMRMTDSKAVSQFIRKGIAGEDIVLKSAGTQFFSYTYAADAVSGLLYALLLGKNGAAYNIADEASDIRLKDLAAAIAKIAGTQVIFEIPDETEAAGYSRATKVRLDAGRLKKLGWSAHYDIRTGLERTIAILKEE